MSGRFEDLQGKMSGMSAGMSSTFEDMQGKMTGMSCWNVEHLREFAGQGRHTSTYPSIPLCSCRLVQSEIETIPRQLCGYPSRSSHAVPLLYSYRYLPLFLHVCTLLAR